ncbi:hypothetical protein B9H00_02865 [Kushneria marisflavi]|uniref:Uncharacterized protein n=1 Tax=Kushneria marisflavi TaxID=157779 RepID=A0A240ULZ1_9GAMM|nr:hypothetical protein B9H00_02865 [Kushneria marisflavi]
MMFPDSDKGVFQWRVPLGRWWALPPAGEQVYLFVLLASGALQTGDVTFIMRVPVIPGCASGR